MLRLSVSSVRGHFVRFLLTALAVTLGVAFVSGSFVLRDSISNTLDNLINSATKGVDVVVRGAEVEAGGQTQRRPVPVALADTLAAVDGVSRAVPDYQGNALIVGKDGTVVRNGGAPTFGFAYRANDQGFVLVAGRGPTGPGEIAVEKSTLEKSRLAVGDTTQAVVGDQPRSVRIVGEVTFGSLFGATAILLDEETARAAFAPDGTVTSISLTAAPGVSQSVLRDRVTPVLPSGIEAATEKSVSDESRSAIQTGLGFFTTFLLVFAGITLFVGAFIIVNTFAILLAQRTRELALLRAVGASRGQVTRMVLGEALLIGLLGSVAGIAVGVALATGLKSVIHSFVGVDISGGLPLHARTIWISLAVGTLVTLVSAVLPARRAARIPPVAAMRDDLVATPRSIRRRGTVGVVLFAIGTALLTWQVTRSDVGWPLAGTGAALMVIGALVAAPLVARPVVRVIVWPFTALGGVVGRLAGQNALRVPRRTANTASALMIGLALVAALSVVAASVKASVSDLVAEQLTADYVLSAGGQAAVPGALGAQAGRVDGVKSVARISYLGVSSGSFSSFGAATSGSALADTVKVDLVSGSLSALDDGKVLVNETTAKKRGWAAGSTITATVGTLRDQPLSVAGVFKDNEFLGVPLLTGTALYEKAVPKAQQRDAFVLVKRAPGADPAAVRSALTGLAKPYVVVSVQDGTEYVNSAASQIDQLLGLLYVLLALSILIAVLGIVNTLALSVVERTREIGLLRAVGLARGQLARMITIEAVATAIFGAVLGAALGLGLGTALQHGLSTQGLNQLAIPWSTIITVLVASAIVGVLAAILPAIRAVRLDVLRAIATE